MNGNIPVLHASGRTLAGAWENSLLTLWNHGCEVKTQYDKPEDPASIDSTMMIEVEDPTAEPRIHLCFPGGFEDLQEYVMELVEGVKDHWVADPNDPEDKRWAYTYHERLTSYKMLAKGNYTSRMVYIDQLATMIHQLASAPHTRRAVASTWQPWRDPGLGDPPCLNHMWARMLWDEASSVWCLNMNVLFRSRDAFKAAFMNMYGMAALQQWLCEQVQAAMKNISPSNPVQLVVPGRYCDISNSYHIYGKDIEDFKAKFLDPINGAKNLWEDRAWSSLDERVLPVMQEARENVMRKIAKYDEEHKR